MADHPCDHTHPRRYVYGGMRGDSWHCRCGHVFTAADFRPLTENPISRTCAEAMVSLVSDQLADLRLGGTEDRDAGIWLGPA